MPKGKHILLGKVYANWCGHCRELKPVWKQLKTFIKTKAKSLGLKVDFVEIEESQKKKMAHFKKWNPDLEVSGYPTIFKKKKGGQIEYYNGERELDKMRDWVLDEGQSQNHYPSMNGVRSGGESEGASGGKGRRKTKKSKSRKTKSKTEKKSKRESEKRKKTKRESKKRKTSKNKTLSRITSLFSFGK
jgi:thiol-disulfide isomerase/thioredoxin